MIKQQHLDKLRLLAEVAQSQQEPEQKKKDKPIVVIMGKGSTRMMHEVLPWVMHDKHRELASTQ